MLRWVLFIGVRLLELMKKNQFFYIYFVTEKKRKKTTVISYSIIPIAM